MAKNLDTLSDQNFDCSSSDLVKTYGIIIPCYYFCRNKTDDSWIKKFKKQAPDNFLNRDIMKLYRQHKLSFLIKKVDGFYYYLKTNMSVGIKYIPENLSCREVEDILNVKWGGARVGAGRRTSLVRSKTMRVAYEDADDLKILFKVTGNVFTRFRIERNYTLDRLKLVEVSMEELMSLKKKLEMWQACVNEEINLVAVKFEKVELKDDV